MLVIITVTSPVMFPGIPAMQSGNSPIILSAHLPSSSFTSHIDLNCPRMLCLLMFGDKSLVRIGGSHTLQMNLLDIH